MTNDKGNPNDEGCKPQSNAQYWRIAVGFRPRSPGSSRESRPDSSGRVLDIRISAFGLLSDLGISSFVIPPWHRVLRLRCLKGFKVHGSGFRRTDEGRGVTRKLAHPLTRSLAHWSGMLAGRGAEFNGKVQAQTPAASPSHQRALFRQPPSPHADRAIGRRRGHVPAVR